MDHKPPFVVVESTRRGIGIAAIACVPAAAGVTIRWFSSASAGRSIILVVAKGSDSAEGFVLVRAEKKDH